MILPVVDKYFPISEVLQPLLLPTDTPLLNSIFNLSSFAESQPPFHITWYQSRSITSAGTYSPVHTTVYYHCTVQYSAASKLCSSFWFLLIPTISSHCPSCETSEFRFLTALPPHSTGISSVYLFELQPSVLGRSCLSCTRIFAVEEEARKAKHRAK